MGLVRNLEAGRVKVLSSESERKRRGRFFLLFKGGHRL